MIESVVKERPILFSGAMVNALRRGAKTQSRRLIKPQPKHRVLRGADRKLYDADCINPGVPIKERFAVGMRLWVRETFLTRESGNYVVYRADYEAQHGVAGAAGFGALYGGWKPSIFMPRKFSRITLEITDIRVQRLNEISEEDAEAEGVFSHLAEHTIGKVFRDERGAKAIERFAELWKKLNGPGSWELNPWIFTLTFKVSR